LTSKTIYVIFASKAVVSKMESEVNMGKASTKGLIVRETLERFPQLSCLSVSRYLVMEYGELFEHNLENARSLVRYHRGLKKSTPAPNPVRSNIKQPQTKRTKRERYSLPQGVWLVIADLHVPFHEMKPRKRCPSGHRHGNGTSTKKSKQPLI
jgi:hypothetical protein